MNDLVSIIIPTRNSGTIRTCLESIKNQTYKNIEIIIVNRFSKGDIIKNLDKENVRVIIGPYNKYMARNIGFMKSKGDIIFFADADYIFEDTLIEEIVNIFQRDSCDAMGTPTIGYNVPGLRDSIRHLETGFLCSNNGMACRAELLLIDNNLRYELSNNALEFARGFSWNKGAEKLMEMVSKYE